MNTFDTAAFFASLPVTAGALILLLVATFVLGALRARHAVIDVAWGLGFVLVAAVSFVLSAAHGDDGRRLLLLILVALWGLRLAGFIAWRARGAEEDPRYQEILAAATGSRNLYAVRRVYLPQAAALFFVSLCIQVGMFAPAPLGFLTWIGVAIWAVGLLFESVGDAQLAAFKADPAKKGTVLNSGLWRYTRHPNYFGDAAVWWGLFLVCADSWPSVLTILSPVLMTWALASRTGKPLTEQRMSERPGYREYIKRTSGFVPLPPKKDTL